MCDQPMILSKTYVLDTNLFRYYADKGNDTNVKNIDKQLSIFGTKLKLNHFCKKRMFLFH